MTISEIEKITEQQAQKMAIQSEVIKEHNIYFVDLGEYFKYSALVFINGRHIHYADEYELHHPSANGDRERLTETYRKALNNKLFTEDEITGDLSDYDEYRQKSYYLHNYYVMRVPYVSMFQIFHDDKEEKAFRKKVKNMIVDPAGFCYVENTYREFVDRHMELTKILAEKYRQKTTDYEYLKSAIKYEMGNHEYQINYQGNWEVVGCVFGDTEYSEQDDYNKYFDQLNLNDIQRKAYIDARREYLATCEY